MLRQFTLLLAALFGGSVLLAAEEDTLAHSAVRDQAVIDLMLECMAVVYSDQDLAGTLIYVSVDQQRLFHVRNGRLLASYPVSTAARGMGSREDSYRTPTGLHRIAEKLGDGVPPGGIFTERRFSGLIAPGDTATQQDLITSRILWLEGLEHGVNRGGTNDSHARFIYIHGTTDEARIGSPASLGCVRMRNADVIALYNDVRPGTLVLIQH